MSDVIEARHKLAEMAEELDSLSRGLAEVSRRLEPIEAEYQAFVDDYELGLLKRSEDQQDYRLPSEALRLKLARRAMDPGLLGRYMALIHSRDRMVKRISDLAKTVSAQEKILSALKLEVDATR